MRRATLAVLLLFAPLASAEEVPVSVGVTVMLKVLTYEIGFEARGGADFVVLLPFAPERRADADATVAALAPVARAKLKTRNLVFVPVKAAELAASVEAKKASAILLLPKTDDALLAETRRLGREAHVYTLGLDEAAVEASVALGVTVKDSKPHVVININQARAEGSEFPQSILKIAKVLR